MRASFQFDELDRLVQQTIGLGSRSPVSESALDCLERESFLLQELFTDNPNMAVTGELFEVAERLASRGELFRVDQEGGTLVWTDGHALEVRGYSGRSYRLP